MSCDPNHQLERALGVGAGGALDEKLVETLPRKAEDACKAGLVAVTHEISGAFRREFVPEWRGWTRRDGLAGTAVAVLKLFGGANSGRGERFETERERIENVEPGVIVGVHVASMGEFAADVIHYMTLCDSAARRP